MNTRTVDRMKQLCSRLGLSELPMGVYFTGREPESGFTPQVLESPSREREQRGEVDWPAVFQGFSCVMGHVWRARRKRSRAWFSAEQYGCPGGSFWLGFHKPQTEAIIHYVSTGIPGLGGELYCESPDRLRQAFEAIDPEPAAAQYCVVEPLEFLDAPPELVTFFARPEAMSGLHQLAFFVTNDLHAVVSEWGAACTGMFTWPLKYKAMGREVAVVGGWDPSARKYFKADELCFTVPWSLFTKMTDRFEESFLSTKTWDKQLKKVELSNRTWGNRA
ncbi:MAG TPA: DUF169 domain-containing protein [Desulfomicrobiaceae bacterium]|nr:DUF169 domain-containing protein [Desulfomicrobiaceae bacterium]